MENLAAHIEALALERSRALVQRDVAAMERILADEFVYVNSHGEARDKAAYIKGSLQNEMITWREQTLSEIEVFVMGDYVVLTCLVHDLARWGDETLDAYFRSVFLYGLRDGEWRCLGGNTRDVAE